MTNSNILIVLENMIMRSVLSKQIEEPGIKVTQASDMADAMNKYKSINFDMIISESKIKDKSGYEFFSQINKSTDPRKKPVLVLITQNKKENIKKCFDSGASAYIEKTTPVMDICKRIKEIYYENKFLHESTVLIVDDSESILKLLSDALTGVGFKVFCAKNGLEGLYLAEKYFPDLILIDLNMPEMDGYTLCEKLKYHEKLSSIPYIVISTEKNRSIMRRMMYCGARGYLVKPFDVNQLIVTVEKLLSDSFQFIHRENIRLELERNYLIGGIMSLVEALEARDAYTRHHSEEVALLLVKMAREMGFNPRQLEEIELAGKLHDIGKIGVPDSVLLKPGPLSSEEFEIIKKHPVIGKQIISRIPSLAGIAPVVGGHHERLDGRGYPEGLKGDEIPLWAKMLAVADTYNALTSVRPYRDSLSHEQALEIINKNRGTQLCPECVNVFLKIV